jgi:hypothetical protein
VQPLLTTPRAHDEWPDVVSADIRKHVGDLQSQLQVVNSLVKGKIRLPYPKYRSNLTQNGQADSFDGNGKR